MSKNLVVAIIAAVVAGGVVAAVSSFAAGAGKAKGFGNVEVQVKEARGKGKGPGIAGAMVMITPQDGTSVCQGKKPTKAKATPVVPLPSPPAEATDTPAPEVSAQPSLSSSGPSFAALTKKNGKVTARGCPAGAYTVTVTLPDGFTMTGASTVNITVGEKKKVKVRFTATGATQRGNATQPTARPTNSPNADEPAPVVTGS